MQDNSRVIRQDISWKIIISLGGFFMIALTFALGFFLFYRGIGTFTTYDHSVFEFLFSSTWAPADSHDGGGKVGAAIFIFGSISTCLLALLISLPFSIGVAIFMTEISPGFGRKIIQPIVEIFVGIPSVVYGWLGFTVLVPVIKDVFDTQYGFSVLAASLVLAIMIFPTITSVSADAIRSVPKNFRQAAFGLGSTRWQVIYKIVLPAAKNGILTGVILGLARAFGEALAVAMVIGKTKVFPVSILSPTTNLTSAIAADMGGAMDGGEYNIALWTMALLLFFISLGCIFLIHYISESDGENI